MLKAVRGGGGKVRIFLDQVFSIHQQYNCIILIFRKDRKTDMKTLLPEKQDNY